MHAEMNRKPIGKCRGCPLNLKKRCAVFAHPQKQWRHGHKPCKGYMNQTLYEHYIQEQMQEVPPKTRKQIRQEKMAGLKTVEHQDGTLTQGARHW